MDLISVIVPVFQVENYLQECLDSVLNQTYSNIEVILVDDGSKDSSGKICDFYQGKDERVKVIHQVNSGSSCARNAGLRASKGAYICFIDSDDIISSFFVENLYLMLQESGAEIAICDYTCLRNEIYEKAYVKNHVVISKEEMLKNWHGRDKRLETVVWNKMYDRELFDYVDNMAVFPEGKLHEDIYVSHMLFQHAKNIAISRDKLYFYRKREDSVSKSISKENMRHDLQAQRDRMCFFMENHYYGAYTRLLWGHFLHKLKYLVTEQK